jgi:hypothetical protein
LNGDSSYVLVLPASRKFSYYVQKFFFNIPSREWFLIFTIVKNDLPRHCFIYDKVIYCSFQERKTNNISKVTRGGHIDFDWEGVITTLGELVCCNKIEYKAWKLMAFIRNFARTRTVCCETLYFY